MKTGVLIAVCITLIAVSGGCRFGPPQYRASAKVVIDANGVPPSQAAIDSEVQTIRSIAPSFVSADERFDVRHISDTSLIDVTVTTPDPDASANSCNQIVEKYVSITNAPVTTRIVEKAVAPSEPTR